jgi:hypothetical protein
MNETNYHCAACGKMLTGPPSDPIPHCCGKPMESAPLPYCTTAPNAEMARGARAEEPCDDATGPKKR